MPAYPIRQIGQRKRNANRDSPRSLHPAFRVLQRFPKNPSIIRVAFGRRRNCLALFTVALATLVVRNFSFRNHDLTLLLVEMR